MGLATGACRDITADGIGVLLGNKTFLLQDDDARCERPFLCSGARFSGVGPDTALSCQRHALYVAVETGKPWMPFFAAVAARGIIPAMESAHAVAYAMTLAPTLGRIDHVVYLSGEETRTLSLAKKQGKEDDHGTH